MYVPATLVPPAPALAPIGVVSAAPATIATPLATTIKVRSEQLNVLESHRSTVTGTLLEGARPGAAGRTIALQAMIGHGWKTIAKAQTATRGRFRFAFRPHSIGSRMLRLRFKGDATAKSSRRRLGRLNVYRLAGASWYGGGGGTACGQQLTSSTLGVANKTLPCGTLVTLRYNGHTVRVPVIDRGPYVAGREFDLTEATKRALGFGDTGNVWSTN
ncbi:MAG TPA: septal ring lytic transglycosylase RlpA family protein [Solirubrobacteraceae bacterium]|nr:septal ring lytic transglycosylase RlpA family protein [Solirubrobacteraceae bacterium]